MPNGGLHGDYGPELPQEREARSKRECVELVRAEWEAFAKYVETFEVELVLGDWLPPGQMGSETARMYRARLVKDLRARSQV